MITLSLVFYCTVFSSSSLNASRLPTLVSDIQMTWVNISERQVNLKVETTWNGELIRNLKARTWYQIDPRDRLTQICLRYHRTNRSRHRLQFRGKGVIRAGADEPRTFARASISRPPPSLQPGNRIRSSKHPRSQSSMDGRRSPSSLRRDYMWHPSCGERFW